MWAFSLDTLFVWGIDLHQFVSAVLKMRWNIWHFIKLVSIWYVWTSKWWHLFACRGKRDIYIVPKKDNIHSVDLISFPNNPKCILINKKKRIIYNVSKLKLIRTFRVRKLTSFTMISCLGIINMERYIKMFIFFGGHIAFPF